MIRNSLKKVVAIILTLVALAVGTMPIYAAEKPEPDVSIQWVHILETDYSFWFEDEESGEVCIGGGTDVPVGYNAYVKVELQKYSSGWSTIQTL